jgi:hypothetical protein
MARTEVRSKQIKDGGVKREDLNTTVTGRAVITRVIAGTGVSLSSTGVDSGTGDVTINATGGGPTPPPIETIASPSFTGITTNNTPTVIGELVIPDDDCVTFQIYISAQFDDNSTDKNYWAILSGAVRRRNDSDAELVGTVVITEDDENAPNYLANVSVDDDKLQVVVTGDTSEDVNWKARTFLINGQESSEEALIDFPTWDSADAFDFEKVSTAFKSRLKRHQHDFRYSLDFLGSLSGSLKYNGGVLAPNGCIYGVPRDSTSVLKIDTSNDTITTFGSFSGAGKWAGGVLAPNGFIYCIPHNSTEILKINPINDTTTTIGSLSGTAKWYGGVLAPNGCIYGIPWGSSTVLKIDTSNDNVSTFGSLSGSFKWGSGCLAPDGKIYGTPYWDGLGNSVLVIDPSNDTTTTFSSGTSAQNKWLGMCITHNELLVCAPIGDFGFLVIDYKNQTTFRPGNFGVVNAHEGIVYSFDGKACGVPKSSNISRKFDPVNFTTNFGWSYGAALNKYVGGIAAPNGAIYFIPSNETTVAKASFGVEYPIDFCLNPYYNKF